MTLFAAVEEPGSAFVRVLGGYFEGEQNAKTLHLLARKRSAELFSVDIRELEF